METTYLIAIAIAIGGAIAGTLIVSMISKGKLKGRELELKSKEDELNRREKQILNEAEEKAEIIKKNKMLEAKEKFLQLKSQHEKEVVERNKNVATLENKVKQQEANHSKKLEEVQRKENELEKQKDALTRQTEAYALRKEEIDKMHKQQVDKLEKIANKAIDRPTTTNHNTVNNKFELNTFPSQREIDQKIESQFNDKYILDGMKGVAQFVFDHIVKLEDGSMAYACFDTSRQIFKYKDEYGMEIKDPKAVKLRKMIKPGLLRQSKTLLDYFNDECDYLEKRKDNGFDIDNREYSTMNTLREKAFEVGCDILSIEETNKFSNELANLSCV